MTFARIRAYLQTREVIGPYAAGKVLGKSRYAAGRDLCRHCRRGLLLRVERAVYKLAPPKKRKQRPIPKRERVLAALREHGMLRPPAIQVYARLLNIKQAYRVLHEMHLHGLVRRVDYGLYDAAREAR